MESNIEALMHESLNLAKSKFKNDPVIQEFEKAILEFQDLVQKGLAKKRGHNLLSISDNFHPQVRFNN